MSSEWFKTAFDEKGALYEKVFVPSMVETNHEVDFVLDFCGIEKEDKVIDICCGSGRHVIAMASRSYFIDGVDISSRSIKNAKKLAYSFLSGRLPRFFEADVRDFANNHPKLKGQYDIAINLFSSFGYLETEEDELSILRGIRSLLKEGGKIFLDLPNKHHVLKNFSPTSSWTKEGLSITTTRRYDLKKSRIFTKTIMEEGVRSDALDIEMTLYSLEDMERILRLGGFKIIRIAGDFDGSPFDNGEVAKRMLILARKI